MASQPGENREGRIWKNSREDQWKPETQKSSSSKKASPKLVTIGSSPRIVLSINSLFLKNKCFASTHNFLWFALDLSIRNWSKVASKAKSCSKSQKLLQKPKVAQKHKSCSKSQKLLKVAKMKKIAQKLLEKLKFAKGCYNKKGLLKDSSKY